MNNPAHLFRAVSAAFVITLPFSSQAAQTPVLRWAFDAGKGAPLASTWISGGTLRIDGAGAGYATFQPAGGVGPATPGVFNGAANVYGDNIGAARISSLDSPLIADAELPQFVITMWIKPTVSPADQPYARLFMLSSAEEEKSKPGLFISLHNSNIEVGVNGDVKLVQLPPDSIKQGAWTFIAFAYDGFAANPYYSTEMLSAVKASNNGAILVGGLSSATSLAGMLGINTGGPSFNIPVGPLALNGLSVSVGSSSSNRARAFCGLIDDIRVYSGLMTLEQIEAVRRESLAAR